MRQFRIHLVALAIALLGGLACAEPPPPGLDRVLRNHFLSEGLSVISGRVVNAGPWRPFSTSSSSTGGDTTEQARYQGTNGSGSFHYERKSPQEEFSVELSSQGEFRFRRVKGSAGDAKFVPVELLQPPGQWLSLAVGPEGSRKVYRADPLAPPAGLSRPVPRARHRRAPGRSSRGGSLPGRRRPSRANCSSWPARAGQIPSGSNGSAGSSNWATPASCVARRPTSSCGPPARLPWAT